MIHDYSGKGGLAMSDNEKRTKPKYETPIVVDLGELARGAGACTGGSGDADTCTSSGGIANAGANTCTTTGSLATGTCTGGSLVFG